MAGKPFADEELEYIAYFYPHDSTYSLADALDRSPSSVHSAIKRMIKNDELEFYRECYKIRFERYTSK